MRSAAAKAILVGEHAVVHGQPALALPLSQIRVHAIAKGGAAPLTVIAKDLDRPPMRWDAESGDTGDPLRKMTALTLERLNWTAATGEIRLESAIPIASGLGSGAAVSAALGRAIAALRGACLPVAELNALVFEVEKLHHGAPSGIDNTVVVYERPVYFAQGHPLEFVEIRTSLRLLLADTGIAASTRAAVAHVRDLRQRRPARTNAIFEEIGAIVKEARSCLESGEAARLGPLMRQNHALLRQLEVSSAALDKLVAAALEAGALGAKLSGGGLGGCMIALVDQVSEPLVRQRLLEAGAKRVFATTAGTRTTADDLPD